MVAVAKIQHGRPSSEYGTGRRCAFPGCNAILSRYNPTDICASHVLKHEPYQKRGIKVRKDGLSKPVVVHRTAPSAKNTKVVRIPKITCSTCHKEKPATRDYFHMRGDKLRTQCKVCVNISRRRRNSLKSLDGGGEE